MSDDNVHRLPAGAEGGNAPVTIFPHDAPERMQRVLSRTGGSAHLERAPDAYYTETATGTNVVEIYRLGHWETMVISIALAQLADHPTELLTDQVSAISALQRIFGAEGSFVVQASRPAP